MRREKTKWEVKRERLEQNATFYRMLRRVENGPLYERIAFMELKQSSERTRRGITRHSGIV